MWIAISACLMAVATVLTAVYVGWAESTAKRIMAGVMTFPAVLFFALVMTLGLVLQLAPVALR